MKGSFGWCCAKIVWRARNPPQKKNTPINPNENSLGKQFGQTICPNSFCMPPVKFEGKRGNSLHEQLRKLFAQTFSDWGGWFWGWASFPWLSKSVGKDVWHFLTIFDFFALREKCRKVPKMFWMQLQWHFLTIFDAKMFLNAIAMTLFDNFLDGGNSALVIGL